MAKQNNMGEKFLKLLELTKERYSIKPELYDSYNVKRGLRNPDGTGVLAGLTAIGEVKGYIIDDGERVPVEGGLFYRGIDVFDLVKGFTSDKRFGFEETAFLLLFGILPSQEQLDTFNSFVGNLRQLPDHFTEDMIMKAPSPDIMNKLARSILASYSYDNSPDDISIPNSLRQSIELIARIPTMAAYAFQTKRHYYDNQSLYIHSPQPELSTSQNFLYMIRPDNQYTELEAEILDLMLVLHAEHGGGNNSAFACRVVSSTGTDTFSAIAAAVGSLKGPKHGGANAKVMFMMDDIKANVKDWGNDAEVEQYLKKILSKQASDKSGLIYGMGHAVYTISDPRAILLKEKACQLSLDKGHLDEYALYDAVERLTPKAFAEVKGDNKVICANVDLYSGFVYKMLGIPAELYTPLFAISRIVGWCAHRMEEIALGRIMRPGYKSICERDGYTPLSER